MTTEYRYDALNRLTAVTFPNSSNENQNFIYDNGAAGDYTIGRLAQITDESGSTTYTYNHRGQVTSQTSIISGETFTTQYSYNTFGELTNVIYPNGLEALYSYDSQSRVDAVSIVFADGSVQPLAQDITYQPFGPLAGFEYGNGINHTRIYDQDYRLTAQTIGTVLDRRYTYDANSNITGIEIQESDLANQSFAFDSVDRITSAAGSEGNRGYWYDFIGNRTQLSVNNQSSFYNYATGSNRLTSINGQTNRTLTLDNVGNTLVDVKSTGTFTSNYNHQNRLSSISNGITNAQYLYNTHGQRVQKTVNGLTTRYVFDSTGALLQEINEQGSKTYFYLAGQPLAVISEQINSAPLANEYQNPVQTSSQSGNSQEYRTWNTTAVQAFNIQLQAPTNPGMNDVVGLILANSTDDQSVSAHSKQSRAA